MIKVSLITGEKFTCDSFELKDKFAEFTNVNNYTKAVADKTGSIYTAIQMPSEKPSENLIVKSDTILSIWHDKKDPFVESVSLMDMFNRNSRKAPNITEAMKTVEKEITPKTEAEKVNKELLDAMMDVFR